MHNSQLQLLEAGQRRERLQAVAALGRLHNDAVLPKVQPAERERPLGAAFRCRVRQRRRPVETQRIAAELELLYGAARARQRRAEDLAALCL